MPMQLEHVFNEAAFPEVTFVEPKEYAYIKASFKTPGKHITISGASGTGKTTIARKLLRELAIPDADVLWINGRQYADVDSGLLLLAKDLGTAPSFSDVTDLIRLVTFVVIDDFHFIKQGARLEIALKLKLWHEKNVRFIIIGIASSAEELYGVDPELGIRNDPYELKTQSADFCRTLLEHGSAALNIAFSGPLTAEIIKASNGVPSIVHVIARVCCIDAKVEETEPVTKNIDTTLKNIREAVLRIFHGKYRDKVVGLAKGKQQAKSVHNTYFDIVSYIANSSASEIPTEALYRSIVGTIGDPKERARKATSFYNCLNNLSDVIEQKGLRDMLFYKKGGSYVSIEDPSFRFYLNLLDMEDIKSRIHLRTSQYPYDVAVSFAGDVRAKVEEFVGALKDRGLSVFYDFDQQAQLWGKDLRVKLSEVYANEALYMVVFLSKAYPERNWTDFELSVGKAAPARSAVPYLRSATGPRSSFCARGIQRRRGGESGHQGKPSLANLHTENVLHSMTRIICNATRKLTGCRVSCKHTEEVGRLRNCGHAKKVSQRIGWKERNPHLADQSEAEICPGISGQEAAPELK